jgi:type IV pilus assembly protein PilN
VYLKSLKQTGDKISIVGLAQSNARVSTLMRSIEDSPWINSPTLIEIHASTTAGARLSEFSLNFRMTKLEAVTVPTTTKQVGTKG